MSHIQRSREDLPQLQSLDRAGVLDVLGSFEDDGLSTEEFADRMRPLLVPDLDLPTGRDAEALGQAVIAACPRARIEPASLVNSASVDAKVLATAKAVLENRFSFYDEEHQLPAIFDWDANPGTAHWGHDLNRFNYLPALVSAFRHTQDDIFARKAIDLILDWVRQCRIERCFVGTAYVFGSYLNNAIHIQTWARTLQALLDTGLLTGLEFLQILKSIHEQIAYLRIVTGGHGGNWPTIGCQGMLATLAILPVFAETERSVDYCIDTLGVQIDEQILPDGVQDELTPHYHTVVINNLLTAAESLAVLNRQLHPRTMAALRRMLHYQEQTIVPDRSARVAFNDSDPEIVPDLTQRLERLGLQDAIPADPGPELFPYAGVAFLRQRPSAGDLYLAFDGGPFGRGHQHEDQLGFWLHAYGRNLIVDPGRHLYDQSTVSYLPYLRGTSAHSTILIDGEPQHSRGRPETWVADQPCPVCFSTSEDETRVSAAYTLGYGGDNSIDVIHTREIVFVRQRYWLVFDRLEGEGTHEIESRFQFAPGGLHLDSTGGGSVQTQFGDANLLLRTAGDWDDMQVEEGREAPVRSGWYSASYNRIEPAPVLSLQASRPLPWSSVTLLFPFRGTVCPDVAMEVSEAKAQVIVDGAGTTTVIS